MHNDDTNESCSDAQLKPDEQEAQEQFEQEVFDKLVEIENDIEEEIEEEIMECERYMLYEQALADRELIIKDSYLSLWIPGIGYVSEQSDQSNVALSNNNQPSASQNNANGERRECSTNGLSSTEAVAKMQLSDSQQKILASTPGSKYIITDNGLSVIIDQEQYKRTLHQVNNKNMENGS